MPPDIQQLAAIRSQTLARLAEITAEPKPSYRVDGQEVAWGDYLAQLQCTIDWCDAKLARQQPIELQTRGST